MDIRLMTSFPRHPKIRRLKMRLGAEAVLSLITLWLFARENRPDGKLTGMNEEDIELAAEWSGKPGALVEALADPDRPLLDLVDGVYVIHDWEENNPWAAGARERSEHARRAAKARWKKNKQNQDVNARSINEHCPSIAPSINENNQPEKDEENQQVNARSINEHCTEHAPSITTPRNDGASEIPESNQDVNARSINEQCPSPFLSFPFYKNLLPTPPLSNSTTKEVQGEAEQQVDDETRRTWEEIGRIHFQLFRYVLKPAEFKALQSFPPDAVLRKYQEALERAGTKQEVRFFSWIERGLRDQGKKPGFFKRVMFGGAKADRERGFRVDVG